MIKNVKGIFVALVTISFVFLSFVTMCFVMHGDTKVERKKGLEAFDVDVSAVRNIMTSYDIEEDV